MRITEDEHGMPEMVSYHREHFCQIRTHTPAWIRLGEDKREFAASVGCHMGYVQPIYDAVHFLWLKSEVEEAIEHLTVRCREALNIVRSNGFMIIREQRYVAEVCRDSGEPYMRFHYRIRRDTETARDVFLEFIERSRLLLTGSRSVPEELFAITAQFNSEVMALRACAKHSERFHAAMNVVIPHI